MTWIFEQSTGNLVSPSGEVVASGYAGGNCGKNPEGRNNPALQNVPCIGPLPVGTYTFGLPVPVSKLGPYAIPLIPDSRNEMYGRGDFYMHGDRVGDPGAASEGCIIMPRAIRDEVWASDDHTLMVVSGLITEG